MGAGDKLGQLEIMGPLGAGGMGEAYLAEDSRLGRKVADFSGGRETNAYLRKDSAPQVGRYDRPRGRRAVGTGFPRKPLREGGQ